MKIKNKRELQNIAIKHSADIHYKDFTKILRKCTAEPHSFLIDYTTLPADNPLHFLKKCFITIIKMTLTDEIKILEDKIKANQTQYNQQKVPAKISALSSGELEKNEYLTVEDLAVKKAKFEYSPLSKLLNEGLEENDKKIGLLKRLQNTEDKNEKQSNVMKDQREN